MEAMNPYEQSINKKFRKTIWTKFLSGIKTYELIQPGDKIAVCISGGKDSMLMALCFKHLLRFSEIPFEVEYLVMDPGYHPENRQRIEENAAKLGIPVHIFETQIFEAVSNVENAPSYLCAQMRRYLYKTAQDLGCNKIALGHHFDDVIETILMGMLYGSQMQTMMPKLHSENFAGMQLIRPMYLVREDDIIHWTKYNALQFIASPDDNDASKRQEVKQLLKRLRADNPAVDMNIFRSVENVNLHTLISYHRGEEYHHFLDRFHEEP